MYKKISDNDDSSLILKYSIMAFPLAFLGIPLYIYIPKFYHDYYGVSLEFIGIILFLSRLFDAFIDPLLGVISDKWRLTQHKYFIFFSLGLIFFFNALFYLEQGLSENFSSMWFGICTISIYLCFSLIFINYYNLGLNIVNTDLLKVKLSSFRELSGFLGMIFASISPLLLMNYFYDQGKAFSAYAIIFSFLIFAALIFLPKLSLKDRANKGENFYQTTINNLYYVYKNASLRWLIIIFFINSLPIAITSNLLSFYVDKSLGSQDSMLLFLITYLVSGFLGALICLLFFKSANKINVLLLMMSISAISFSVAYFLDPSTSYIFYFVCVISGIGSGGELVMLPAIASDVLEDNKNYGNTFFALWASCTKITLAIAAGIFLPLISISGNFLPNITLDNKIKFYYAVIPLIIKFISIIMVLIIKAKNLRGL